MDVLKELEGFGAVLLGKHFVLKSGRHAADYVNPDPMLPHTGQVADICRAMALPFSSYEGEVETVAAPATGGIVLAVLTALSFNSFGGGNAAKTVWADKDGDEFAFERAGFIDQVTGHRVLVVDDVMTTKTGSVFKVCRLVEQHGGILVGASVVCNRGGVSPEDLGVPRLEAQLTVDIESYEAEACPRCEAQAPIVEDIGHGDKYRVEHPNYPGGYVRLLG